VRPTRLLAWRQSGPRPATVRYGIVKGVSGDRHHWIQASLLGGFGRTPPGGRQRNADIEQRLRTSMTTVTTTPDQVAWEDKLYRLLNPGQGVDPDVVDQAWTALENGYREAVAHLEAYSTNPADIAWLISYVCAAGVRHPEFAGAVNRWRADAGLPLLAGDDVQIARLAFLNTGVVPMAQWRWRIAHSRPGDTRFIISDLGWTYVSQQGMAGRGPWIPLTSRLAALTWSDPANPGKIDHQDMRPGTTRWVNAGLWEEAPDFVIGHPDDKAYLAGLRSTGYTASQVTTGLGAYYGHEVLRPGLFADL
jgi:hypothetical protein